MIVYFVAELAFAGLGATYILGTELAERDDPPIIFGLRLEAVAFALSFILQLVTFIRVIFAIKSASPDGARPWGAASTATQQHIRLAATIAAVFAGLGLFLFALDRADVIIASIVGQDDAERMFVMLPYVYIPIIAITLPFAAALEFWGLQVGMVAVGILLAMLWGLVLEVVRVAAGVLVTAALWLDVALVALWDLCCKPFTAVWNTLLAERTVFARTLPRIHYCDPRDLMTGFRRDLREKGTGRTRTCAASAPRSLPSPRPTMAPAPDDQVALAATR